MAEELKVKISVDGSAAIAGTREVVAATKSGTQEIVKQLHQVEVSAAQTAAAMRNVPAQFTDIVVSLQAGQNPMTVLLQQGGQLKDMFGGTGAAAKALGGYVMGMINPMTVAAAATAAFSVAAYQGAQEHRELAKAIILSGNAAGVSVDQLKGVAASVAQATGATKGALADALGQIALTGKVAADNMGFVAEAAITMASATGKAVSESVAEFAELGKAPVKASIKLNEQYNYLTASVYAQIKALEDQGRATEAATLAQKTYADEMTNRAKQIKDDLGSLETAWNSVGKFAKQAWDKMLNVGREGSIHEQIAGLAKQLQTGGFDFALTEGDIQAQIAALRDRLVTERQVTEEKAKQTAVDRAKIQFFQEEDKYADKGFLKAREIAKVQQLAIEGKIEEKRLTELIANIEEKYKEKGRSGKSQAVKDAEELAAVLEKISSKENGFDATFYRDIDTLYKAYKRGGPAAQTYADAIERLAKQQKFYTDEVKEQQRFEGVRAKYLEDLDQETQSLIKKAEAAEIENAKIGMTAEQLAELIRARHEEAIATLETKASTIEAFAGRNEEVLAIEKQIGALRRLQSAEVARPKLQEQAKEWEKFTDDINRSLTDALMRGFESGKSYGENFVDSLRNSLKTSALKIVVNMVTSTGGSLLNSAINYVAGSGDQNGGSGVNYFGLASNASSLYNLANGSYLSAATNAYNTYAAGTTLGGYTLGYIGAGGSGVTGSVGAGYLGAAYGGSTGITGSVGAGSLGAAYGGSTGITGAVGGYGSATAGTAGTATGAPASGGLSAYASYVWPIAVIAGMYMSSEAYKNGIKWENYAKTSDAKNYDLEVLMRKKTDDPMRAIFGDNFVESEFYAVMSGSSLSAQIHYAIQDTIRGKTRVTGTQFGGTFAEDQGGFDGQFGTNMKRAGGWFSGNREWTEWQALPDEVDKIFDVLYRTTRNSFVMLGETFDDSTLAEKLKGFEFAFNEGSGTGIDSAISKMTEQLSAAMGGLLFPSIEALRKTATVDGKAVAETWNQTFARVMIEAGSVSRIFDMMGEKLTTAFGRDDADNILAISDAFVAVFGSVDALNASFNAYYENFYSQEEKTAQAWEDMTNAFTGLNKALPATRAEFRALVNAAATAGDTQLYKSLLDLQGGFAALTPSFDDLAQQAAQAEAAMQAEVAAQQEMAQAAQEAADAIALAAREAAEAAAAASRQVLTEASAASQSAALQAYNTALEQNNSAIADQVSGQKALVATFKTAVDNIRKYRDSLALSELSVLNPGQKYDEAKRQFDRLSSLAQIGNPDALTDLPNAAREFLAASQDYNASGAAYLADYNKVLESLDKSEATASRNVSAMDEVADSTSSAARSLLSIDDSMRNLVATVVAAARNGVGADSGAIAAIRAAGGTDQVTGAGATASYLSNRGAVAFVDGSGGLSVTGSQGGTISRNDFKAGAMAALSAGNPRGIYDYAWQNGMTLNMVDALVGANVGTSEAWARAVGLPVFAQGADRLPGDMFAFVHQDERIVPAGDNRRIIDALEQDGAGGETASLLRELIAELRLSREANTAGQREIVLRTAQLVQKMGAIEQNGNLARAA